MIQYGYSAIERFKTLRQQYFKTWEILNAADFVFGKNPLLSLSEKRLSKFPDRKIM